MDSSDVMPSLQALTINKNSEGWGPSDIPPEFKNMPYQPFSKDTRLGKIADWSGNVYQDMKYKNRYNSLFGGGGQYAYYHDDDDTNFQTAGSIKPKQVPYYKNRQRMMAQRKQRASAPYNPRLVSYPQQNQQNRIRQNIPGYQNRKLNPRQQDNRNKITRIIREPSIQILDHWPCVDEIDLNRLTALSLPSLQKHVDLADFGELGYFDPALDRVNTKSDIPLTEEVSVALWYSPMMSDTVVSELIKNKLGNVFMSTQVASFLMCCPKSVYSWDVVAYKTDNGLLIDFRDEYDRANIYPVTMNETAQEPPPENLIKTYNLEGIMCNEKFKNKVILSGPKAERFMFPSPIPDLADDDSDNDEDRNNENKKQTQSFGYRYRLFDIGNGIKVVIRCEVDAAVKDSKKSTTKFACTYALTECPQKAVGAVDWRSKLDTQVGAVLASELKNNSFKLSRFITRATLSGAQFIKLGFLSRINPKDIYKHTLLGVQHFKTPEFAQQIGFNVDNAWGILRCILEHLFRMPDGTYIIQKDANKPILRFHTLPTKSFLGDEDEITADMDDEQIKELKERQKADAEERLRKVNEALGSNKLGTVAQSGN